MAMVWIHPTAGKAIYADDKYLPPCNKCGERIATCRESGCDGSAEKDS